MSKAYVKDSVKGIRARLYVAATTVGAIGRRRGSWLSLWHTLSAVADPDRGRHHEMLIRRVEQILHKQNSLARFATSFFNSASCFRNCFTSSSVLSICFCCFFIPSISSGTNWVVRNSFSSSVAPLLIETLLAVSYNFSPSSHLVSQVSSEGSSWSVAMLHHQVMDERIESLPRR